MPVRLSRSALLLFTIAALCSSSVFAQVGEVIKPGLEGVYSYRVRSDGKSGAAFVQTNVLKREKGVKVTWIQKGKRLAFVSGTQDGERTVVARAVSGRNAAKKARWEVSLQKVAGANKPKLVLRIYEQGRETDYVIGNGNRRSVISVSWTSAKTRRSNNGTVKCTVNGKLKVDQSSLDNRYRLGAFIMGMLEGAENIKKNRSVLLDDAMIIEV